MKEIFVLVLYNFVFRSVIVSMTFKRIQSRLLLYRWTTATCRGRNRALLTNFSKLEIFLFTSVPMLMTVLLISNKHTLDQIFHINERLMVL